MEENIKQVGPLETLAGISDQFTLLNLQKISTEVKIKLSSIDYMGLMRKLKM